MVTIEEDMARTGMPRRRRRVAKRPRATNGRSKSSWGRQEGLGGGLAYDSLPCTPMIGEDFLMYNDHRKNDRIPTDAIISI